jgi:hypothetical protein
MNSYRYRITVEKLADAKGEPVDGQSLSFYAANHEDILEVVNRMKEKLPFDAATAASLGVGLQLFSEVMLVHREEPLFAGIRPAIGGFMQYLNEGAVDRESAVQL